MRTCNCALPEMVGPQACEHCTNNAIDIYTTTSYATSIEKPYDHIIHDVLQKQREDLIKLIKQLEPLNNKDCPEWVINVIKGEQNGVYETI